MKQYNKTHCPEVINYKGEDYKMNIDATHRYREGDKLSSRYHIRVNVLSKNLKGRTDLHGNPYKANVFIYSTPIGFLPVKLVDTRTKYVKELNRIKKYGYGV
jgi:hypothetical protein